MSCATYRNLVIVGELLGRLTIKAYSRNATGWFVKLYYRIRTLILNLLSEGKQIGLKERLLGAIGTIKMPLTPFDSIGPPAERE